MSYINKALRKLQKEKKTRYVAYDHIISAPGKKSEPSKKWLSIIGILIVFFFAAGMIVLLYGLEDKKVPVIHKISALPVAPPVVKEPEPNKNKKVEFKSQKTTAKVRTKQEIAESKALYTQALQKQHEGKLEEAQGLYKKVIKIDRLNVQALNNLGVIYMSQRNYKKAITCFHDALNIKHDYGDAHYNLACLYAQKKDTQQSLFYLKNAIEFSPKARQWAKSDSDLKVLADLPEFKNLVEKQ